jgi:hypothetical protein
MRHKGLHTHLIVSSSSKGVVNAETNSGSTDYDVRCRRFRDQSRFANNEGRQGARRAGPNGRTHAADGCPFAPLLA